MNVSEINFQSLANSLLTKSESLLREWLPNGRRSGNEWLIGSLRGEPGDSCRTNLVTGKGSDFATGQVWGDLISLYAQIHGITQIEAGRQLSSGTHVDRPALPAVIKKPRERVAAEPVPPTAPVCTCSHYSHGNPSQIHTYRNANGRLLGYVARYDTPEGKQYCPWTFKDGKWGAGSWSVPRPLYGLEDLAKRPTAHVLICEGEKSADAARILAPASVVITWSGGSQSWQKSDFSVLSGREVTLWPDADEPGTKAMWAIGHELLKHCRDVQIINVDDHSNGWDAADAVNEGWDRKQFDDWAASRTKPVQEPQVVATAAPVHMNCAEKWLAWGLQRNAQGSPIPNLANTTIILDHCLSEDLHMHVQYDGFLKKVICTKAVMLQNPTEEYVTKHEWSDEDDRSLCTYIQYTIGIPNMKMETVAQAVLAYAEFWKTDCLLGYLESLQWDGTPRIELFFEDHFGASGTAYTRAASRNFFLSMIARAYQPGCKADNMIVLEGEQGTRKSSALKIIGDQWYAEMTASVEKDKDFSEILQGKWLIEVPELDSFGKSEVTRVKAVLSRLKDRFRVPFSRHAQDFPRRCIFAGSTNSFDWNRDPTGARRFWPIRCNGQIDVDSISSARDQLFAEAVVRYRARESWWEMPEAETMAEQSGRYQEDAWREYVEPFLSRQQGSVTSSEVLETCLKIEPGRQTKQDQQRLGAVFKRIGYERFQNWRDEGKWYWRPKKSETY